MNPDQYAIRASAVLVFIGSILTSSVAFSSAVPLVTMPTVIAQQPSEQLTPRIVLSGIPAVTARGYGATYDTSSGLSEWKGKLFLNEKSPEHVSGALVVGRLELRFSSQLTKASDGTSRIKSFLIHSSDMTFAVVSAGDGRFETRIGRPSKEVVYVEETFQKGQTLTKERAAIFERMMNSFRLLPLLSYKLGAEMGIKGNLYPAALPIHGLALSIARHEDVLVYKLRPRDAERGGSTRRTGTSATSATTPQVVSSSGVSGCAGMQPGSQAQECYGQCGPASQTDCTCWDWVCGDCCCHVYCRDHDADCSCGNVAACAAAAYKYLTGTIACGPCDNPGNLPCAGPCPTGQTYCSYTHRCQATGAQCQPQCGPGQRYCPGSHRCVRKTECTGNCGNACGEGFVCYQGRCMELLR